eukprot:gene6587-7887_t
MTGFSRVLGGHGDAVSGIGLRPTPLQLPVLLNREKRKAASLSREASDQQAAVHPQTLRQPEVILKPPLQALGTPGLLMGNAADGGDTTETDSSDGESTHEVRTLLKRGGAPASETASSAGDRSHSTGSSDAVESIIKNRTDSIVMLEEFLELRGDKGGRAHSASILPTAAHEHPPGSAGSHVSMSDATPPKGIMALKLKLGEIPMGMPKKPSPLQRSKDASVPDKTPDPTPSFINPMAIADTSPDNTSNFINPMGNMASDIKPVVKEAEATRPEGNEEVKEMRTPEIAKSATSEWSTNRSRKFTRVG